MFMKLKNICHGIRKNAHFILVSLFLMFSVIISVLSASFFLNLGDGNIYTSVFAEGKSKLVILDAGHGGEDCGAIGRNGIYEKDLNLEIALILGEYLKRAGYTVVYTRTEDKLLYKDEENIKGFRKIYDLKNRVAISSEYPEAVFISIHMNSFSDEKYSGLQVYYGTKNTDSLLLAQHIQNEVKSRLQANNSRIPKRGENIYVMENVENVGVLVECGFLTNATEAEKLSEKEYQKELCFAILCGIINYIEDI